MQLRVACGIFRRREGFQNETHMIILYSYVLVAFFTFYTLSSAYDVFRTCKADLRFSHPSTKELTNLRKLYFSISHVSVTIVTNSIGFST
jgi:hypothetical protein